jgi:uncharacterized protein YebE (UPF0316 family)
VTLSLVLAALTIFALRIADVTLGTLRIAVLVRGRSNLAGVLSFFESLVWLVAAAQVLTNLDQPLHFVAYAGGYGAGTMLGVHLERWLAIGDVLLRIVAPVATPRTALALRQAGYIVTEMNAEGRDGQVRVSFVVLPRRRIRQALKLIGETNPDAFASVEPATPLRVAPRSPASPIK